MVGSSAGGAGVLGLFLALQSAGVIPSQPKEPPKSAEEIRREIAQEQARASLLEHLQQSARSNSERLQQLASVMSNMEEALGDLEEEGKRAESHLKQTLNSEFGFLVQACFDDYPVRRRKARKQSRLEGDAEDQ